MNPRALLLGALTLAACESGRTLGPDLASADAGELAAKPGPSAPADPAAIVTLAPSLSETQYVAADARGPIYRDRDCSVHTQIFSTTANSGSGDAILHTSNPKYRDRKCSRTVRFRIATTTGTRDESLGVFANLRALDPPGGGLPVDATGTVWVPKVMVFNVEGGSCERLLLDGTGGSSLVEVNRTGQQTWSVRSAAGSKALCEGPGELVDFPFTLTIEAL